MGSIKSLALKKRLAKKARQNRPIPYFVRAMPKNRIHWNYKRRHWRRTKLGITIR